MSDIETTVDVDDDILLTAQTVQSHVDAGQFVQKYGSSKSDAQRALRDLLAGADAVAAPIAACELASAAVAAIEACFAAQLDISAALHEQVLRRMAVAARDAFGSESSEAQRAQRQLAAFASRLSIVPDAPAPAANAVAAAAMLSPLGMRCWHERCPGVSRGAPLMACSRCKIALYCGADCQACDWRAGHKSQCKAFVAAKEAKAKQTR